MIVNQATITIPSLVRVKSGTLAKLGTYCQRQNFNKVTVVANSDLPMDIRTTAAGSLQKSGIDVTWLECSDASFELAQSLFVALPGKTGAIIGIGGGRAVDVAKYLAFMARLPNISVPTALSNDGFCSPGVSLTIGGKRRSLPAALPFGLLIDTDACLSAPRQLWLSGVGDLVAKLTAVRDWKLAFHAVGEPVNDFAALLSDATVHQFISRPVRDEQGTRLLGTALMLNGIAMEICGSSRPASGSEHLISHALDAVSARPRLHGIQVGMATYLVSRLQGEFYTESIGQLFDHCGFWDWIRQDPFCRKDWQGAFRLAPAIKEHFYTVLSSRDCLPELMDMIASDKRLDGCFV